MEENKSKVTILRHHPMNVLYTNSFYTSQVKENSLEDYVVIDVTSRIERDKEFMKEHPSFVREISPFYMGPLVSSDGVKCNILEIFWQCSKVYPCHDDNGKPTDSYFKWRNDFFSKTECTKDLMRHSCHDLGYENKDCRYFLYYDKDKKEYVNLNWVESRKKVYVKEYAKLVYNTESYKYLKSIVDSGKKLAIIDFDGYNFEYPEALRGKYKEYINKCKKNKVTPTLTEDDFLNVNDIKKVLNCPFMSCGHVSVLKMLLDGTITVKDGEVIDKDGVLD